MLLWYMVSSGEGWTELPGVTALGDSKGDTSSSNVVGGMFGETVCPGEGLKLGKGDVKESGRSICGKIELN